MLLRQKLPSDCGAKLEEFQRYGLNLCSLSQMPLGHIGNTDQALIFLCMPMSRTIIETGAPQVRLRTLDNEKTRPTVMLACLVDELKLPPYIILRRKTIPKELFPRDMIVLGQEETMDHLPEKSPD
ncbi:hypothetical protein HPB51_029727 [Rhipicephalus microplus]|uniref:Uncharacterized protein n=1 Tax=Rhipicephalus microplus TaxID=6941 RepID=A0A9J6CTE8_RHIMP|nr:hypothetical protein HPB51_029727 [Rhipicephalus microplus]